MLTTELYKYETLTQEEMGNIIKSVKPLKGKDVVNSLKDVSDLEKKLKEPHMAK